MKISTVTIVLLAVSMLASCSAKTPTLEDVVKNATILKQKQLPVQVLIESKTQQSQGKNFDEGFLGFKENMSVKEVAERAAGLVEEGKLSCVDDSTYMYNFAVTDTPLETDVKFNFFDDKLKSISLVVHGTAFDAAIETAQLIAFLYMKKHIIDPNEDDRGKLFLVNDVGKRMIYTIVRGKVSMQIQATFATISISYGFFSFPEEGLEKFRNADSEEEQLDDL